MDSSCPNLTKIGPRFFRARRRRTARGWSRRRQNDSLRTSTRSARTRSCPSRNSSSPKRKATSRILSRRNRRIASKRDLRRRPTRRAGGGQALDPLLQTLRVVAQRVHRLHELAHCCAACATSGRPRSSTRLAIARGWTPPPACHASSADPVCVSRCATTSPRTRLRSSSTSHCTALRMPVKADARAASPVTAPPGEQPRRVARPGGSA